jgi:3-hydroxyisobutyrate dehydrogenase
MTTIAFIGLGHMGNPMAHNLIKNGHTVRVYDLFEDNVKALAKDGAVACQSALEASQAADVTITMVQTGQQVKSLCLGEDGLFAKAKPNSMFIDCSSIDIGSTHDLHEQATHKGLGIVDAPVSGGVKGAETAGLTFMVGGTDANFERAKPILELMGKKIVHAGKAGTGQAAKMCNNMLLGISMIGVCETFNLAKKLGLEAKKLYEISSNASGNCWSLSTYPPVAGLVENVPAEHDFKPGFAAKMMLKDLLLSQNAAQSVSAATPLGAEATSLYQLFVNQGFADKDFSGIIEMLADKS